MTTDELVEKVAKAACAAVGDDWDWSVFYIVDANDDQETGREAYREIARAAIAALEAVERRSLPEG